MKKCDCELCQFENPKTTATAIVIKEGKILVLKRNEEPFIGEWDFPGGYLRKEETPDVALKREIQEELGADCQLSFFGFFTGLASYRDFEFPVLNIVYHAKLLDEIKLNVEENTEYSWIPLGQLTTIAFDVNKKVLAQIKENQAALENEK